MEDEISLIVKAIQRECF